MNHIIIKRATADDLPQLQKTAIDTFSETFSAGNAAENMEKYLQKRFSQQQLLTELSNPLSEFYLATIEHATIGYLKLNLGAAQTELKDQNALEIERIYVKKEYLGNNVGKVLFEKALQRAREANVAYIWLGVWEENLRAVSFYKKNGFVEFDKHVFQLGDETQTDLMMKLVLN